LGYHLLIFVYDKIDDPELRAGRLQIIHTIFVDKEQTGDYQITRGIRQLIADEANKEELIGFMMERNLPADEIILGELAEEILNKTPPQGYLTISNALQWRLQYQRAIDNAGVALGVERIT